MRVRFAFGVLAASLVFGPYASAATLFVDNFNIDPASNGWTESISQGSDTTNLADIRYEPSEGAVIFETDYDGTNGADSETFSITRTLNAAGFANLAVSFDVREQTTFESVDNVRVQIDTGSGFTNILAINSNFGDTTLGPQLLGSAADNTTFDLRIISDTNAEDMFLERIKVFEFNTPVLYADDFSIDPTSTGSTDRTGFTSAWTVEDGNAANGFTTSSNGTEAVLSRDTSDTSPDADDFVQLTHTFSTEGYEKIALGFNASPSGTAWENADNLEILYSTDGSTFTSLLQDFGIWHANNTAVDGGTGNTDGAGIAPLFIDDALAEDNPNFTIRIRGYFNATSEDYLLDNFTVYASLIPTPAALPGGLMLMGALLMRRRR